MTDFPLTDASTTDDTETAPVTQTEPKPAPRRSRRPAKLTPKDITRVIEAYDRLRVEDDETLGVLAALTGAEANAADLTAAMLSGRTASLDLIGSITEWNRGSEMDATLGIYQLSEKRPGLSSLWSLLHTLGAVSQNTPPRNPIEATRVLVMSIRDLDSSQITTLQRVVDIAA